MKQVLITGAAGGLGVWLCQTYLSRGYRVHGWDIAMQPAMASLLKDQENLSFDQVDVSDTASVEAAARRLDTDSLDILINAAAILAANSANVLEEFDIDGSRQVLDINSLGPLRVVKALLPLLKKGGEKVVVNISSEAGSMTTHCGYINRYDYCMSKAALNIQSIILQRYLEPEGFKVLLACPGWMKTTMGGAEAPTDPADSARGIADLAAKGRDLRELYIDYDGSPRAW